MKINRTCNLQKIIKVLNILFLNYCFILYLFYLINASVFNLMVLLKARFFLKTILVVIYAKDYITVSSWQFTKALFQVTSVIYCKRKFGNLYKGLIWATEIIKASWSTFSGYYF